MLVFGIILLILAVIVGGKSIAVNKKTGKRPNMLKRVLGIFAAIVLVFLGFVMAIAPSEQKSMDAENAKKVSSEKSVKASSSEATSSSKKESSADASYSSMVKEELPTFKATFDKYVQNYNSEQGTNVLGAVNYDDMPDALTVTVSPDAKNLSKADKQQMADEVFSHLNKIIPTVYDDSGDKVVSPSLTLSTQDGTVIASSNITNSKMKVR